MKTVASMRVEKAAAISDSERGLRWLTVPLLLLALTALLSMSTLLGAPQALAAPEDREREDEDGVTLLRLGKPCFEPVDFHLFTAPTDNLVELSTGPNGILPEPNHKFHPQLGVGPGAPHDPPYDREFKEGLKRLGIRDKDRFSVAEFSFPNAVFFTFMVVAEDREGCPRGSSPDYAEGPIIPNQLFPFVPDPSPVLFSRSTGFLNGRVFDPAFIVDVPRLDRVNPPFLVDGHSHIPIFLFEAKEFGPGGPVEGRYRLHSMLMDQAGNGWDINKKFTVR
jgi:hypothetical protein